VPGQAKKSDSLFESPQRLKSKHDLRRELMREGRNLENQPHTQLQIQIFHCQISAA